MPQIDLHYHLQDFMPEKHMPLWVVPIPAGKHHARCFHDHFHSELVIILSGSGEHLLNGKSTPVSAGDVLLIHPGVIHAYDKTSNLELVNIIYDAKRLYLPVLDGYSLPLFKCFFPENSEDISCSALPLMHLEKDELKKAADMINEMNRELKGNHSGNNLLSLALLMQLVVMLCRNGERAVKKSASPFRIGEIISFLKMNYHTGISIKALAKRSNMSTRNFFLIFKKTTGSTPIKYLINLRVMHAAELLLHTDLNMTEIAQECGFSDSNYFCRKFRETTGIPPRQFRLSAAKKNGFTETPPGLFKLKANTLLQ
ncbi:MAG: helix-turn-helix domain-containing protein [Lentisphaerae bacterium]|nr:helix-turn-helix domain-containing protein [Lentisphaerota bacterium]